MPSPRPKRDTELTRYQQARNLSDEQMAEMMTALLGRKITASGWGAQKYRAKPPKEWAEALRLNGAAADPPVETQSSESRVLFEDEPPFSGDDTGSSSESPPTPPTGAKIELPPSARTVAAERIRQAYGIIGYGASVATQNRGISVVTDAYSPAIAEAWLRAAEENEFCRRVVAMMSAGGAAGELVLCHVIWIGGLLYVSGRIPNVGGLYGRFDGFRVVSAPEQAGEAPPDPYDAARQGAAGPVGDAPAAAAA